MARIFGCIRIESRGSDGDRNGAADDGEYKDVDVGSINGGQGETGGAPASELGPLWFFT